MLVPDRGPLPLGQVSRIPRVARLMALAIRMDRLIQSSQGINQKQFACLGHGTTARMSQILNFVHLVPDIQEQILFLARQQSGRDPLRLRLLQTISGVLDWKQQRRMWKELIRGLLINGISQQ